MNKNLKKRFREHGFKTGFLPTGKINMITDVSGIRVGHVTKIQGNDIRTGITLIDPGVKNLFRTKLPAAISVGNGFGKLSGYTQIEELGTIETPIALTNTLAVGPVMRGVVDLVIKETTDLDPAETINAVVGETNDGFLNLIHRDVVTAAHVEQAQKTLSKVVAMGNVGAGTGTRAFSWKGGIGTASRALSFGKDRYTLGALVQTNYGGALTILGVPIGILLGKTDFMKIVDKKTDGSCMIILATDAPLTARQLRRIAARAMLGLGRTGSVLAHGSGDYAIAFTTNRTGLEGSGAIGSCLPDDELTGFFLAAVETVEESVYDALFLAETMSGRNGHVLEALPVPEVISLLRSKL